MSVTRVIGVVGAALAACAVAACPGPSRPDVTVPDVPIVPSDVVRPDVPGSDVLQGDSALVDGSDVTVMEEVPGPTEGGLDLLTLDIPPIDTTLPPDVFATFDALDIHIPGYCELDGGTVARECTGDADCTPMSQRCLATGCATVMRCQPAGRPCGSNADCLAGSQTCIGSTCVASGADCGDTRACPYGYTCEGTAGSRACVNRRRPCTDGSECPFNGTCFGSAGVQPFCVGVATRCSSDAACLLGAHCRDLDGDGLRECVPDGPCRTGMCGGTGANICEILPVEFLAVCGPHGLCSASAPCPAGFTCRDAWGTGVTECRADASPCNSHAACAPPRSLCFDVTPPGAAAPGCAGP